MDWKGWKPYLCNVNSKPASILVNLDIIKSAPIATRPWLLWIWVKFKNARPDGLSDCGEAPVLYGIEDALLASVSEACRATPCGRITTEGRREFYFYAETTAGFRTAVATAMSEFDGYEFSIGEKEDTLWKQYTDVLYPSPESLQCIGNMQVLDALVDEGDVLTVAREVEHWAYFASAFSRNSFKAAALAAGFIISSEKTMSGERPFSISLTRTQPVDQKSIDQTTIELLHLSLKFGGEYDGWETRIVTQ